MDLDEFVRAVAEAQWLAERRSQEIAAAVAKAFAGEG